MKQSEIVKEIEEFIKNKFNTYADISIKPEIMFSLKDDIAMGYNIDVTFKVKNTNDN